MQQDRLLKGYEWKTLGEISLSKGQYGSGASKSSFNGRVRYIRITDIDDNGNLKDNGIVSPSEIEEEYFLENNDLLFARSGSVGRTYIYNQKDKLKYQFAGYLIRFKINEKIALPKYIYYFTKSKLYLKWVNSFKKNVTLSNINAKEYASLEIPILPLETQKQIVSILEKAEKLKERRKIANGETNKIIQSIFYEIFGDPDRNEKKWKIRELKELITCLDSKRIPIKASERKEGNIPYYGANGQVGWIDKPIFDESLLLLAEDGADWGKLKKCSYRIKGKSWVNNHAHVLKSNKNSTLEFLEYFLNISNLNGYISGSTRGKLNRSQMNKIKVPTPPIELQDKFAEQVRKIEKIKQHQQRSEQEINTLFDALMQKAFNGELVK